MHFSAESAIVVESPAVIKALEGNGITLVPAFNHGATMRTGVQEYADLPGTITVEDDFAAADVSGQKVVCQWNFRLMADKQPAATEDALSFKVIYSLIDKGAPMHTENSGDSIVLNPTGFFPATQTLHFGGHRLLPLSK
jgi:hypothetical protein